MGSASRYVLALPGKALCQRLEGWHVGLMPIDSRSRPSEPPLLRQMT